MPFAARSHLPQCWEPCDPLSSCSFLWSWMQSLSESINYLFGWEGISVLAVSAGKQGHCPQLMSKKHWGGGCATWNHCAVLDTHLISLQTERSGPKGRFSARRRAPPPHPRSTRTVGEAVYATPVPTWWDTSFCVRPHSARSGPPPENSQL